VTGERVGRIPDLAEDPMPGDRLHRFLAACLQDPGHLRASVQGFDGPVLSRFDEVRSFVLDDSRFPGGAAYRLFIEPVIGRTFISMDGEEHLMTRRLATPAFRSRPVAAFVEHELVPLAHEVVDRFADRGEADLVAEFTEVLPFWAISRKIGMPRGGEEEQRRVARSLLSYMFAPDAAADAAATVARQVEPLIAARRETPADDVITRLVQATDGTRSLSDVDVVSHIRLLYAVGATTTSDVMGSMFFHLLSRPEMVDRAVSDPAFRRRLVREVLRFDPPVPILPRVVDRAGEFEGIVVSAGQVIFLALAAANRDPAVFGSPDLFDPDRPEQEILSFGFGPKHCPGMHLGRQQLEAALAVVLERLPGLRLVDAEPPSGSLLRSVPRLVAAWDT
jgi:cytochrome P450